MGWNPALGSALAAGVLFITRWQQHRPPKHKYRVYGSCAQSRVGAQLHTLFPGEYTEVSEEAVGLGDVEFIWQNAPTKSTALARTVARSYNHLMGSGILEDKCNMALLQKKISTVPMLAADVVNGRGGFMNWCRKHCSPECSDRWVVKDAGANGAGGVWVFDSTNWAVVAANIGSSARCVVQEYVKDPLLWEGRKFHIRMYVVLTADSSMYVYKRAFLHAANKPYSEAGADGEYDDQVHITNCCANKGNAAFAGEIVVDLEKEYGAEGVHCKGAYDRIKKMLAAINEAAAPFMSAQRSRGHFEYIGVDVMVSNDGRVWHLENNCPPGMETATGLPEAEALHNDVSGAMVKAFVAPAMSASYQPPTDQTDWDLISAPSAASFEVSSSEEVGLNTLKWIAYKRSCK